MTTPLNWITDRLPTEADGDKDGDVVILLDGDNNAWCGSDWWGVKLGQAWLAFTPPATASTSEPTPLPWITDRLPTEADGDGDGDVIALGDARWYTYRWSAVSPGQPWLLFAPPATPSTSEPTPSTPAPLTRRIVSITRTIHGATETIDAIADDGTAWWMVPGEVDWTQLPPLPDRDAQP